MISLRAVLEGAKVVFANPKLKMKNILEWSSEEIDPHYGEVSAYVPDPGVYVAILLENDKRSKGKA